MYTSEKGRDTLASAVANNENEERRKTRALKLQLDFADAAQ